VEERGRVALRTRSRDRERERERKKEKEIHARRSPPPDDAPRASLFARRQREREKRENRGKNNNKKKLHRDAPELLNPCFAVTLPFSADKRVRFTDARTYALFFFTHCHTSSEEHSTCDLTIFFFSYFFLFCEK
jgi:hypothetical protein